MTKKLGSRTDINPIHRGGGASPPQTWESAKRVLRKVKRSRENKVYKMVQIGKGIWKEIEVIAKKPKSHK